MGTLHLLCREGDRTITWDADAATAADPEAAAAVEAAEAIFNLEHKRGSLALLIEEGLAKRLDAFDPRASRIVVLPRVVGG